MRTWIRSSVVVLALMGSAAAEEPDEAPSKKTEAQPADSAIPATEAAVAAVEADDRKTLTKLAAKEVPDPWIVADNLWARGHGEVATAFAQAVPKTVGAALVDWLERRRGQKPDAGVRKALNLTLVARNAEDWKRVLEVTDGIQAGQDTVAFLRIAYVRGTALRGSARYADCVKNFQSVAQSGEELGWLTLAASAHREAGWSACYLSDWPVVVNEWNARLRLERKLGSKGGAAETLGNLGLVEKTRGRFQEAYAPYQESLAIWRELGDEVQAIRTLRELGVVKEAVADFRTALTHYEESLALSRKLDRPADIAKSLNNIGIVYDLTGNYPQALGKYAEALEIERARKDLAGVARALNNMGIVKERLGDYPAAMVLYREALAIRVARKNEAGRAMTLDNMGVVASKLGNYAEALRLQEESLGIRTALKDARGEGLARNNLGTIHRSLGNPAEALRHWKAALEIFQKGGIRAETARALGNIGLALQDLQEYDEALENHRKSLEIGRAIGDKAGEGVSLNNIGNVAQARGKHDEALASYEAALAIAEQLGNTAGAASALTNIGNSRFVLKDYESAHVAYGRAREILERSPDAHIAADLAWGEAQVFLAEDRPREALEAAERGVAAVRGLAGGLAVGEGADAREGFAGLFAIGCRAAVAAKEPERLLGILEEGRAGSLREAVGSRAGLESASLSDDRREALSVARHAVVQAVRRVQALGDGANMSAQRSARKALEEAQAEVRRIARKAQRESKAAAGITFVTPDAAAEIQARLSPSEALVYYALTDVDGMALVVRHDSLTPMTLAASEAVTEAVDAVLEGEHYVDPEAAGELRKLLVDPLRLPKEVTRVLVSPAGRMGVVPYCLMFPSREVAYVPSGTLYGMLSNQTGAPATNVLGLGFPDYELTVQGKGSTIRSGGGARLNPLSATKLEVETVADVRLLGRDATEAGLSAALATRERWRSVHLACHGLVDPDRPMLSALAVTADETNDGFLSGLEILRMSFSTDLVVLSACESGRGRSYAADGIVGLAAAFMCAGTPRVICSLWKVDDKATQALMIKFYELWNPRAKAGGPERPEGVEGAEHKGLGAAAALKQAQAFVRSHHDHPEWKHPYYWAAWVLWGLPD